jgi:hypothetical protein
MGLDQGRKETSTLTTGMPSLSEKEGTFYIFDPCLLVFRLLMWGNRSDVQGSNQYANIVFDFHFPVFTSRLHLDDPEILYERIQPRLGETEEEIH